MLDRSKEQIVSALNLPKDAMLGEVLLSFVGHRCVLIENYRKILLYTDTLIRVNAKKNKVEIEGKRLKIEYYTNDEMKITGLIKSVSFHSN
jgi:YabP family.